MSRSNRCRPREGNSRPKSITGKYGQVRREGVYPSGPGPTCRYSPSCLDEVFSETGFSGICDFSGTQERPISAKCGISDSTPMASFKSRP
jgi:hypothetical protein